MIWLCLELDELAALNQSVKLFGYGRRALFSIRDADYAGNDSGSIEDKICRRLEIDGVHGPITRIQLITLPRVFGYVFNPVSFYRCYQADGSLAVLVAEVRNTFGEMHHYVLRPENLPSAPSEPIRFAVPKAFYVSPFMKVDGEYEVLMTDGSDAFSLVIHLRQNGQLIFSADMRGHTKRLTTRSLRASAFQLPLMVIAVMFRIHWQGVRLFLKKHLPMSTKPDALHTATIPARRSSVWMRVRESVVRRLSNQAEISSVVATGHATIKGRT